MKKLKKSICLFVSFVLKCPIQQFSDYVETETTLPGNLILLGTNLDLEYYALKVLLPCYKMLKKDIVFPQGAEGYLHFKIQFCLNAFLHVRPQIYCMRERNSRLVTNNCYVTCNFLLLFFFFMY